MSVKLLYTRGWAYQDKKNRQVGQHKTTAKIALDPGNRAFLTGYDGENVLEIGKGDIGRSRGDKLVESYM